MSDQPTDYKALWEAAQAKVNQLQNELDHAWNKWEDLFDNVGDSILVVNYTDYTIQKVNCHAARRLGYARDELIGMSLDDIEVNIEDDDSMQIAWESEVSGTQVYECHYRHKDGHLLLVEVSSRVVEMDGQQVILNFVRDITVRKQVEQQRLELIAEQERTQLLANFFTQASHEFRTPLAIIMTNTYLLGKTENSDKQQQQIKNIEFQVKNIDTLINALMTMVEVDSIQELTTEELDLYQMIAVVNKNWQQIFQLKNIHCVVELGTHPIQVHVNSTLLQQAIDAIVDNAIRFTQEGGTITIRADRSRESAIVEIDDTGIGIGDDDLPHIFERFYRVDKAGTIRGFGLGLAIAKRVIELHKGSIHAESVIGEGSTFRLLLPLA